MYEQTREITIAAGSASSFSKNLSFVRIEAKNQTYAAVASKNQVNMVNWDQKIEGMTNDQIVVRDPAIDAGSAAKTFIVIQVKHCVMASRSQPLLVACTMSGIGVYEWNGSSLLFWLSLPKTNKENWSYAKGIAVQGNNIYVGCHTGEVFGMIVKETDVKQKETLTDHTTGISDLEADKDHLVAGYGDGTIVCWNSEPKLINKISTQHCISCVAVNKGYAYCGTVLGLIFAVEIVSGQIAFEMSAHARAINAFDILENGLLLSGAEDSFVRIWKIRPGDQMDVECVFSKPVDHVPIVGGRFLDNRGQAFGVTGYDYSTIYYFTKSKKSSS